MERAFLHVKRATRIKHEAVCGVMRVGRVEPMNDALFYVIFIIAVSIFEEE